MARPKKTNPVTPTPIAKPKSKSKSTSKKTDHQTAQFEYNEALTRLSYQAPTMPFTAKKRKAAVVEDDDDDAEVPATTTAKRGKAVTGTAFQPASHVQKDDDGNAFWAISRARRVTISEYNKEKMVSIREYYEKDGDWRPGKKGISMNMAQYAAFVQILPQIEEELGSQGETVPRPDFNGNGVSATNNDKDGEDEDAEMETKPNIEATSDEDE